MGSCGAGGHTDSASAYVPKPALLLSSCLRMRVEERPDCKAVWPRAMGGLLSPRAAGSCVVVAAAGTKGHCTARVLTVVVGLAVLLDASPGLLLHSHLGLGHLEGEKEARGGSKGSITCSGQQQKAKVCEAYVMVGGGHASNAHRPGDTGARSAGPAPPRTAPRCSARSCAGPPRRPALQEGPKQSHGHMVLKAFPPLPTQGCPRPTPCSSACQWPSCRRCRPAGRHREPGVSAWRMGHISGLSPLQPGSP